MMNRLENAARLALEWIEDATVVLSHTSTAIQGGLGAEAEGVGGCSVKVLKDLREALAEQAAEQAAEPVTLETVYETIIKWDEGGGKRSRRELARRIVALYAAPTQQPLTDEQKAVLRECRKKAMKWAAQAGIPECAAFGEVAQDLDWLCGQLGIAENEKGGAA